MRRIQQLIITLLCSVGAVACDNVELLVQAPDIAVKRGSDGDTPDQAACCLCTPLGTWECEPWDGDAQACFDYGYSADAASSWFNDCPAAYTDTVDDDVTCPATCA